MNKKGEIQDEALEILSKYERAGAAISMGVGKTLLGLRYIEHFYKKNLRVLVVYPKLSIQQSWIDEANKFGLGKLLKNITFSTYLSLEKNTREYDIIILDEFQNMTIEKNEYLRWFRGRILGLTGTPPKEISKEKYFMMNRYCPIKYTYLIDEAVDDNILNKYRIIVHRIELSDSRDIEVLLKNKEFWISEAKSYEYWSKRVESAKTPKDKQITAVLRMKTIKDFKSKEIYTRELLKTIKDKCIIFCSRHYQADELSEHSYHSNNPESEANLQKFKEGSIMKLSCVDQLSEGINIPELKTGIVMHSYSGASSKLRQRLGRLMRLKPDEVATIHVLCYKNTVDEKWCKDALEDFDSSNITYKNVSQYELLREDPKEKW